MDFIDLPLKVREGKRVHKEFTGKKIKFRDDKKIWPYFYGKCLYGRDSCQQLSGENMRA